MQIDTQKIFLNEESSGEDASFEVLEEVLEGDIYGWDNFLNWKEYEEAEGNG